MKLHAPLGWTHHQHYHQNDDVWITSPHRRTLAAKYNCKFMHQLSHTLNF